MGNFQERVSPRIEGMEAKTYTPVEVFEFHELFEEEDSTNGLCFNGIFVPEEIVMNILSRISPTHLLVITLVCKKWCNIIKSDSFWMSIYYKCHQKKAQKLPWYVFYSYFATNNFKNLIRNGNGQEKYKHWKILQNGGDRFKIENPPKGADPLPAGVPEFNGYKSCFATSYGRCSKSQEICLLNKRLMRYIINKFSPSVYVSEWVAGRFDCACIYNLVVRAIKVDDESMIEPIFRHQKDFQVEQFQGRAWHKVEILVDGHHNNYNKVIFEHSGKDLQFWKGHYGSKMAGGVLRFVFDSIKSEDEH